MIILSLLGNSSHFSTSKAGFSEPQRRRVSISSHYLNYWQWRQAAKGDDRKVRIAARLRQETTMSQKWIAVHLDMGSWTHVSNLLGAQRKRKSLKREN